MQKKGNDAVKEAAMPSPLDDDSSKPPEEAKS
jgi:hypothetical protein